jgi:hypothetical protein
VDPVSPLGRIAAGRLPEAIGFLGVDVDAHDLQPIIDSPLALLKKQPRADAEHDIRVGPQPMSDRQTDVQPVCRRHHTLAPPIRHDRRFEHFCQLDDFGARIERPPAHDDERPLGFAQNSGGSSHRVVINGRVKRRALANVERDRATASPHIHWTFDNRRTRPSRGREVNSVPDNPRCFVRRGDARRVLTEVAGQSELIADFVKETVAAFEIVLNAGSLCQSALPGSRAARASDRIAVIDS